MDKSELSERTELYLLVRLYKDNGVDINMKSKKD